jgi:hypothetical protein
LTRSRACMVSTRRALRSRVQRSSRTSEPPLG